MCQRNKEVQKPPHTHTHSSSASAEDDVDSRVRKNRPTHVSHFKSEGSVLERLLHLTWNMNKQALHETPPGHTTIHLQICPHSSLLGSAKPVMTLRKDFFFYHKSFFFPNVQLNTLWAKQHIRWHTSSEWPQIAAVLCWAAVAELWGKWLKFLPRLDTFYVFCLEERQKTSTLINMLIRTHIRRLRLDNKPTLNEIQGLVFCSSDVLFSPGWRTTWLIVLYQEVWAADLKKRKQEKKRWRTWRGS